MTRFPAGAGAVLVLQMGRAAALAGAALAVGQLIDAVISGARPVAHGPVYLAAGLVVLAGMLAAGSVLLVARQEGRELIWWRGQVARSVLGGPVVPEAQAGATVEALTGAVEQVASYRATFLGPTLGAFAAPVVVLVVLALGVDPMLALILSGFVLLVPVLLGALMRLFRAANGAFGRASARLSAYYLESVTALGTLRILGAAGRRSDRLAEVSERMRVETMALLRRNLLVIVVTDATFGLGMVVVAVGLALQGLVTTNLTVGQALALLAMTVLLVEPVDKLGRSFYVGMIGRAHQTRLTELIDRAGPDQPRTTQPLVHAPTVDVRDLVVRRGDRQVLRVDRLEIPAGARLALVGPTGSGKTTLALVLQGLLEPDQGEVLLDGRPTDAVDRRAAVAAMAQRTYLFAGSVADNIRLAAPDADDAAVWRSLAAARLADEVRSMPAQLDTAVGEGGLALSGGQAQRVALARAYAKESSILVLDEPTADLDARTRGVVESSLAELSRRCTVVTVDHRLMRTLDADLVGVVQGGALVEVGTPLEVYARGGYYAEALAADDDAAVMALR